MMHAWFAVGLWECSSLLFSTACVQLLLLVATPVSLHIQSPGP
jgi:hypothetical protein